MLEKTAGKSDRESPSLNLKENAEYEQREEERGTRAVSKKAREIGRKHSRTTALLAVVTNDTRQITWTLSNTMALLVVSMDASPCLKNLEYIILEEADRRNRPLVISEKTLNSMILQYQLKSDVREKKAGLPHPMDSPQLSH